MTRVFFIFIMFFSLALSAKVRILTFHFNKPHFIELQYKAFNKFCQDDFEIIVFNDAATLENEQAIQRMCDRYGIKCVRFDPSWHITDPLNDYLQTCLDNPNVYSHLGFGQTIYSQPSVRHSHVIQYALDHYGYDHDDMVAIADGDLFPIRSFSVKKLLDSYEISGIEKRISEEGIDYLWVVFVAFDPRRLSKELKFHVDVINNKLHDTGAHTYHYLKNHPEVRARKYPGFSSTSLAKRKASKIRSLGFTQDEVWLIKNLPYPHCMEFHMDKTMLHFCGSSFNLEGYDVKEQYLNAFMKRLN